MLSISCAVLGLFWNSQAWSMCKCVVVSPQHFPDISAAPKPLHSHTLGRFGFYFSLKKGKNEVQLKACGSLNVFTVLRGESLAPVLLFHIHEH